ncbi:hypothetical protein M9H77_07869 [Catharanthus roseus]|uniref:Uncharacterized protein n=1 Tax=Catharanthus roseus TaxID=4058 RepID=A0ACC0BWG0_CATRO|nr:hypothetical protein M9H77_07869 [Catharanthus roseus]
MRTPMAHHGSTSQIWLPSHLKEGRKTFRKYERWMPSLIMSMEAQLPTHYNEGTSGSSHSNLDTMKGTFGPYDYVAWVQEVELWFYSYGVTEEEKFQLVLKSLSYEQALKTRLGFENHKEQRQGQSKIKFMESSMVEESPKVKELSQVKIGESVEIHVVEETSKEEPFCIMSEKSIEINEKERVEEEERSVERLCYFGSISIFSKESEHFEWAKEKESELEKVRE